MAIVVSIEMQLQHTEIRQILLLRCLDFEKNGNLCARNGLFSNHGYLLWLPYSYLLELTDWLSPYNISKCSRTSVKLT